MHDIAIDLIAKGGLLARGGVLSDAMCRFNVVSPILPLELGRRNESPFTSVSASFAMLLEIR